MRKIASLFILCLVLFGAIEVQAFTLQIVADNDFAVFTGNSSGINNLIYQSDGDWYTQVAKRASLDLTMPDGDTQFYILGMGGGGEENISGTVNGIDMVTLANSSGKVMMSSNISSYLTNYPISGGSGNAVETGGYSARLIDVQSAYANVTWSDAISAKNCSATVIVQSNPPSKCGFALSPINAVLFKFTAADVNVDYGHKFVGTTTTMDVYKNASATDIKSLLHFSDSEQSQTITWSQSVAPDQGGTLSFANATANSGSSDITPGGTITYTPKSGYVGTEHFTVQATDGKYSNTRRITVSVLPLQYTVSSSAGSYGSISPAGSVTVTEGQTTSFTIKPDAGYKVDTPITGTCGGSYTGNITDSVNGIIFTTNTVNADCSVAATFTPRPAATRYTAPANVGSGNCINWDNACTLQSALTGAVSGDEIWVKRGTHKPTSVTTDRNATFQLKTSVAVYGGFAGTETALAQRDPATNATVLSGDLLGDDSGFTNNGENSYHVVIGATGAILDGLTISGGNANGEAANSFGGGMYNELNSPILRNVTFSGNTGVYGGGMANNGSNPTLNDVTFSSNQATNAGGGVFNISSNSILSNVTFSSNQAASAGGGMVNINSSPTLINVTFSGNTASGSGDGMFNESGSNPIIRNNIFWGSSSEIINNVSTPIITDSVISGGCPADSTCTNIITNDPLLGTLGPYGGFTQTIPLLPGSSAIGATDSNCPATDQRGVARSTTCSIGAFESQGFTLVVTDGDNQSTPAGTAFAKPLALTVTANNTSEPVNGGRVTFLAPGYEASTTFAPDTTVTIENGAVALSATSNTEVGPYSVFAFVTGAAVIYNLTNIQPLPKFTSATSTTFAYETFGSFTVTATGASSFSTASPLPDGVTLSSDGTLSGTPAAVGIYLLTIIATNSSGTSEQKFTLNVNKADSAIYITGEVDFLYDALPHGPDSFYVIGSTGAVTLSYSGTGNTNYGPASIKPTEIGTYSLTATVAADSNYNGATSSPTPFNIRSSFMYAVSGGLGSGICESWARACELRYALESALSGQEIWVKAGIYKPTGGTVRSATFQLKNGVAVYGGFTDTETARAERDPAANVTILSGDLLGDDSGFTNNGDNSYHVVTGANGATLDGFTITGGNTSGDNTNYGGGGMYNEHSSPTLTNLTFSGNTGTSGGGMFNDYSNPTLTNITFSGNTGTNGGGMLNYFSNPQLTNITFSGNSATDGGGMNNYYSSPTLTNITFSGNTASGSGGGMYNISGNDAYYSQYYSRPIIRNSIFWGSSGGEIFNFDSATANISHSVVSDGCSTGSTCSNIITANPLLGSLGNYGGFTATIPLQNGSSAIDATGSNCPATDQRGVARSTTCDIGAFELSTSTVTNRTLTVYVGGTGTGTVSSAPGGIMCEKTGNSTANCSNTFTEDVTLTATRTMYSVFKEWSTCVGTGTCLVTMDKDKNVTATFNALRIGTDYPTLQEVYDASPDSSVIQLLQSSTGETVGTLSPNRDVVVKLSGGYDIGYLTTPSRTAITGPVRISKGKVIPERVAVK